MKYTESNYTLHIKEIILKKKQLEKNGNEFSIHDVENLFFAVEFLNGYKQKRIGKNIDDLILSFI